MANKYDYSVLLPEYEASGMSIGAWSKMKGYNPKTMYAGLKKERNKRDGTSQGSGTAFIRVDNKASGHKEPIRVKIGKAEIEVDDRTDLELLRTVMAVLS